MKRGVKPILSADDEALIIELRHDHAMLMRQAAQLSFKSLAEKFDVSVITVQRVIYRNVLKEDRK
jgi:hypothetical protein